MDKGWIKIHRKILKNPLCSKPTWAWLWIVLLLLASHEDKEGIIWNGKSTELKKGQFITGRKKLKELTGIPETTIERILKYLENGHQIRQQKTSKFRLITILKWETYQVEDTKADNRRTTDGHNQEYKNIRNILSPKVDAISPPKVKGFQSIDQLLQAPQKHLRLIGQYFQLTGKKFSSPETLTIAVKRWMKDAAAIVKFTDEEINQALEEAQEHKGIWNLGTVLKKLTK